MSIEGQENQGTGLKDVYNILVKTPPERLLSLTIQLGESPEDNIIHALCLIVLHREEQALNKLQMLTDNYLANHLVEMWKMSGGKLEDFAVRCNSQEFTGESLAALARIFKVLSEQRLCDELLRNLAYKRALSTDSQKTSNCEDLEFDQLREEAKVVCGPQLAEWMCSFRDLKLECSNDPHSSPDEGNTSSSLSSYPTHLEISPLPTATFEEDKITPETSVGQHSIVVPIEVKNAPEESRIKSNEPPLFKDREMDAALAAVRSKKETPNQSTEPKFSLPTATSIPPPKMTLPNKMYESKGAEEEEEEVFYAFVILHAQEDAEVAERIKEKLETIISREGATFSEDFAIPGKSTLRCIEDAINNSAFTLLLLTRNFNTRLLEMKTDSALVNSINHRHKYNTVIPLLPIENPMPRQSMPIVLQTIVPLDEKKNFDKKTQKTLSKANIDKQKRIWKDEQRVKIQIERQEELKRLNQTQKRMIQECKAAQLLEQETLSLLMARDRNFVNPSALQPHSGIQITNAKYIMIGNDSQMIVDYGRGKEKDGAIQSDEEQ